MPYDSTLGSEHETFDLGPWTDTPNSTRVSRFRFDHSNRMLQVQWTNNKNHGYLYGDMTYEEYRGFARAVSKGERVNSHLNGKPYRLMSPEEVSAGTNSMRRGIASRVVT